MPDLILDPDEPPVIPQWGDGSLTAMCWASQQKCPSALAKLILLRLADITGMSARSCFYVGQMAEWCCASCEETEEAVRALGDAGLLFVEIHGYLIDAALPWWRDDRPVSKRTFVKTDLRREKWDLQQGKCWYCGCHISCDHLRTDDGQDPPDLAPCEIEHQTPKSQGGGDAKANLVLACRTCNRTKKDRNLEEYRGWLTARIGSAVVFHGERPA